MVECAGRVAMVLAMEEKEESCPDSGNTAGHLCLGTFMHICSVHAFLVHFWF